MMSEFVICIDNKGNPASLIVGKVYCKLLDTDAEARALIRVIINTGPIIALVAAIRNDKDEEIERAGRRNSEKSIPISKIGVAYEFLNRKLGSAPRFA